MKSVFLPALLSTALALTALMQAATTLSMNPAADAFVASANPANNYGSAGALGISATGSAKGEFQSLMLFDFASFKSQFDTAYGIAGWTVDSISLQLTATSPNNAIFNTSTAGSLGVRWFSDDSWTEGNGTPAAASTTGGVTFNSLPSLLGTGTESVATYAFNGATSGTHTLSLTPSAGLLADITSGSTASLDFYAGDSGMSALFNSKNNGTAGNRPLLSITASPIPEPSMGLLALSALLVTTRRRR